MTSSPTRGVYFLANNNVSELAIAFLNSFRKHNPDIALCLIPFNDKSDQIEALRDKYRFTVLEDKQLLAACDEISAHFHDKPLGTYRKLAAWEGPFDEFVYIDTDTIVLDSIDFVFENLAHADIFTSHSNLPHIRKWVWKDSIEGNDALTAEQIAFAANTGFFVSRKNLLDMRHIQSKVQAALVLKPHMELHCMEQPFLNYLIVTSGYRYGSLLTFRNSGVNRRVKLEWWAGNRGGFVRGGKFRVLFGPPVFLLHWAGVWQKDGGSLSTIPYKRLWDHYRNLELAA